MEIMHNYSLICKANEAVSKSSTKTQHYETCSYEICNNAEMHMSLRSHNVVVRYNDLLIFILDYKLLKDALLILI